MIKLIKRLALAATLFVSVAANANLLSIELDGGEHYQVGDSIVANIYLSDIEQLFGVQNVLASFEFDVVFDDSLLSFDGINFGVGLDVDPFGSSVQSAVDSALGVFVSELSYAFFDDFSAAQTDKFLLASLSFTTLMTGIDSLSLSSILLSDDIGGGFATVNTQGVNLMVDSAVTAISEPSSFLLIFISLCLLASARVRYMS